MDHSAKEQKTEIMGQVQRTSMNFEAQPIWSPNGRAVLGKTL